MKKNQNKAQYRRWIFIDEKIRSGLYPNCSTISKEYEVSSRTIARDIEYMKDTLDAPIEYNNSKHGYYYTEKNYRLSLIDMKESDLFSILIAQKTLEQYQGTEIYNQLISSFKKIEKILPDNIKINSSWINDKLSIIPESYSIIKPEIMDSIFNSIKCNNKIEIKYASANSNKISKRIISPYHIIAFKGEWYVIAYCENRMATITFALSRIFSVKIHKNSNIKKHNFEIKKYLENNFGIFSGNEIHNIIIRFTKDVANYIKNRIWMKNQTIEESENGDIIFYCQTNSLIEIKKWILSWGKGAIVIEPKELKNIIKNELNESLKNY